MKDLIKHKLKESLQQAPQIAEYRSWLSGTVKQVKVYPYTAINKLDVVNDTENYQANMQKNKDLKKFIINNIEPNECFHNAYKTFVTLKAQGYDVIFILGMLGENGKLFGHGWNQVNGVNVDFTAEKQEENGNKYYRVAGFSDLGQIQQLDVFNPNKKCEFAFEHEGESYDRNGMCSVYPYYLSLQS